MVIQSDTLMKYVSSAVIEKAVVNSGAVTSTEVGIARARYSL